MQQPYTEPEVERGAPVQHWPNHSSIQPCSPSHPFFERKTYETNNESVPRATYDGRLIGGSSSTAPVTRTVNLSTTTSRTNLCAVKNRIPKFRSRPYYMRNANPSLNAHRREPPRTTEGAQLMPTYSHPILDSYSAGVMNPSHNSQHLSIEQQCPAAVDRSQYGFDYLQSSTFDRLTTPPAIKMNSPRQMPHCGPSAGSRLVDCHDTPGSLMMIPSQYQALGLERGVHKYLLTPPSDDHIANSAQYSNPDPFTKWDNSGMSLTSLSGIVSEEGHPVDIHPAISEKQDPHADMTTIEIHPMNERFVRQEFVQHQDWTRMNWLNATQRALPKDTLDPGESNGKPVRNAHKQRALLGHTRTWIVFHLCHQLTMFTARRIVKLSQNRPEANLVSCLV